MIRALFPGSFDPIHNGHIDIARRSAKLVGELIVGVYDKPLKEFIFSPEERLDLVKEALKDIPNVTVTGYNGLTVEYCKKNNIQAIVRGLRVFSDFELEFRMALANHRLAPEVEVIALIASEAHSFLSSSTVREIASLGGDVSTMVPPFVATALYRRFDELASRDAISPLMIKRD
ncbi:MAG: pantetheine-phosphate adenylyltransferase [Anaerolineaceae bacterium]